MAFIAGLEKGFWLNPVKKMFHCAGKVRRRTKNCNTSMAYRKQKENEAPIMNCGKQDYDSPAKRRRLMPLASNLGSVQTDSVSDIAEQRAIHTQGELELAINVDGDYLTIHILRARNLENDSNKECNSLVEISIIPENNQNSIYTSDVFQNDSHPIYDRKVSWELLKEDISKRLLIAIYSKQGRGRRFLGSMSFGLSKLFKRQSVAGWYKLLTLQAGATKHHSVKYGEMVPKQLTKVNQKGDYKTVCLGLTKSENGFGFSFAGEKPCIVEKIKPGSPAEESGLQSGDQIIRINHHDVSQVSKKTVMVMLRHMDKITLEVQRASQKPTLSQKGSCQSLKSTKDLPAECSCGKKSTVTSNEKLSDCDKESITKVNTWLSKQTLFQIESECQRVMFDVGRKSLSLEDQNSEKNVSLSSMERDSEMEKRFTQIENVYKLEEWYIDAMQYGVHRFSRPLRHSLVSRKEHETLFQNIEKLLQISRHTNKGISDNILDSDCDEQRIGSVYLEKIKILCEAYQMYMEGLPAAMQLLQEFESSHEFQRFLQNPPKEENQPCLKSFLQIPVYFLKRLLSQLTVILEITSDAHYDYFNLQDVIEAIDQCCNIYERLEIHLEDSADGILEDLENVSQMSSRLEISYSYVDFTTLETPADVDSDVLQLQNKLTWLQNEYQVQVARPFCHTVMAGCLEWENKSCWEKVWVILLNDVLLLTQPYENGDYEVLTHPVFLSEITKTDFQRSECSEYEITYKAPNGSMQSVILRGKDNINKKVWEDNIIQRIPSA